MIEKIIDETIDTIIDSIDEKVVDYMYEYGDYKDWKMIDEERFIKDKEWIIRLVIKQLYFRAIKYGKQKNMKYKRKYNITEEEKSFGTNYKVEMWDEYGNKRTIYEGTTELATERLYDFWEETEERNERNKVEQKVLNNLVKKEIK